MQESERIFIAENATLLRGSERELNRQLFTILNSIYDGLYITDGQANTILINRAYEEVSGLRREDVLGKSMQEIVATGMIDRSGSLGVLKTRKPVTLEQTFRTGKQALITSTPHFDSSGEITMIITVVRDMTEIYGLQRKYQESEERRRSEMEFLQRNQRFVSRMVAADPRTLEVLARAQKVAALDTTILLLGETGVGKEQFARYIYENSARARQSFIGINCGAIPASHIKDKLIEMTHLNETLYCCGIACSAEGAPTESGNYMIDLLLANVCKQNVTRFPYEIVRLAEDIAGGLMVTAPGEADFRDEKLGPVIDKYLKGVSTVSTENRLRILRLIENLSLGTAAVGYRTESMHGAGSPQAQRIMISRQGNLAHKKELAKAIAHIKE
ncbi:4-hydroxyphenylacetate 3-hydroxylase C-terminal domain-containing protein [Flavonifractor plautii]|uniref:4-hydroxyphenylacetate 3-hydroxylase C-terminal domain-containing protein n=1 Tax=Flavonifractor plautii TaxID=292800 RepID=UPI003DA57C69